MKMFVFTLSGLFVLSISGCGSIGAGLAYGPNCPYQGVQFDFKAATSWNFIKETYGFVIPLAIIDLPFSFVFDTFALERALERTNGGDSCPRKFEF